MGNPTGGVIPQQDIERIAQLAQKHDFWVLSDEIYARLIYGDIENLIPRSRSAETISTKIR